MEQRERQGSAKRGKEILKGAGECEGGQGHEEGKGKHGGGGEHEGEQWMGMGRKGGDNWEKNGVESGR